jgi:hypothetical protein
MTRFLEICYLFGLPIGMGALICGIFVRRRRVALFAFALVLVGGWSLGVTTLSSRYALIHEHHNQPRSTNDIISMFGKPEAVINYREGDSVWFYYIRVWPWYIETSYSLDKSNILGCQISEYVDFSYKPESSARNARDEKHVRLFLAVRDKTTWVILPDDKNDEWLSAAYTRGRWSPVPADVPAIIDGAFSYVRDFTGDPGGDPNESDRIEPVVIARNKRIIEQIVVSRPADGCQIVGYIAKDGKKMIHLNFFPRLEDNFTEFAPGTVESYWHFKYVKVFDGGASFWQIEYDPATKTFSNFRANGMG